MAPVTISAGLPAELRIALLTLRVHALLAEVERRRPAVSARARMRWLASQRDFLTGRSSALTHVATLRTACVELAVLARPI